MFDFFFRRSKRNAGAAAAAPSAPAPAVQPPAAVDARQRALDQAAAFGDDEVAAAAFILGCSVAEARLLAAQTIHDRVLLEKVRKAMRETDRRVARLMQQRLDALSAQEAARGQADAVLRQAAVLCNEAALRANQVVALERDWKAIASPPAAAQAEFSASYAILERRLQAQAALQRRVLDAIAALRSAITHPAGDDHGASLAGGVAALDSVAADADATLDAARFDPELPSLPKQHLPELTRLREQLQRVRESASSLRAAVEAREQALQEWERLSLAVESVAAPPDQPAPADTPAPDMLRRAWRELPPVADGIRMQALQERFDAVLRKLTPAPVAKPAPAARPAAVAPATKDETGARDAAGQRLQAHAAIDALQAALEEGALQRAMEQDRILRGLDSDALRLPVERQAALSAARAELGRLQGWARWGGTVSREELLATVDALPQQGLAIGELAKKVGSMRERWRALDVSAGPAPRALWLRFDAACTTAYAPVAAHFAVLAQERAANALKAQALLDEIDAFGKQAPAGTGDAAGTLAGDGANTNTDANPDASADTSADASADTGTEATDWHALAAFCQRVRQAWQRLGPLDRKEQKRLDVAFARALSRLQAPLDARQQHEVGRREELIDAVGRLAPQARDTPERLQRLQSDWQQLARAFPLARQQEQALWQRFRAACDGVYAQRKSAGAAADAERNAALDIRQALCASLESVAADASLTESQRATALQDARNAWAAAGAAPRAAAAAVDARFDAAADAVMARGIAARRSASQARSEALLAKLRLCLDSEREIAGAGKDGKESGTTPAERIARWETLPALPPVLETVLRKRFDAACRGLAGGDAAHADLLRQNQSTRDTGLLKLEVACGLDSPPELMRERLALQVAGLQATLRSGAGGPAKGDADARLLELLDLPAATDAATQERLERIIRTIYKA